MHRLMGYGAVLVVLIFIGLTGLNYHTAYSLTPYVANRYDQLSDSVPADTATNTIGFIITATSQPLGSIELQFCEENPIAGEPCTTPAGLDASGAVLSAQTGNTGFSIASNSTVNTIILTRSPSLPSSNPNTYQLDNIVNPGNQGSYYLRIYIYPTTDGSGPATQVGGVAIATNSSILVNTVVPPYLKFCAGLKITAFDCSTATSYLINFGYFSTSQPSIATSQFTVATNAETGYNIYVTGLSLTSGNNVIPNLSVPSPSLSGASQFGINLRANNNPAIGADVIGPGVGQVTANYDTPNRFTYQEGDTLAAAAIASDNQTYTVTYLTNISKAQPVGVYATTLTYICLANF